MSLIDNFNLTEIASTAENFAMSTATSVLETTAGEMISFENGTKYVVDISEPLTFLSVLSISAIITTVSLFFCGIPICIEILRRKDTDEISGFPFIMGFLGGSFWLRYGLLKYDVTMITVNVVGVSLMFIYMLFYVYFTKEKGFILMELCTVGALIGMMVTLVEIYGLAMIDILGFVCMSFNILNFGAPLAGVKVVLRKKCCDSLPLPLCTANLLVSSQWAVYGVLVNDIYIIIPNSAGVFLAAMQLSLFLIFPRKVGSKALLSYCCSSESSSHHKSSHKDPEKAARSIADNKFQSTEWNNKPCEGPQSSARTSRRPNFGIMRNGIFGASLSSSCSTTVTGTTSLSTSHLPGSGVDVPAITVCSSDNEIDDEDVDVETPLNSPSFQTGPKKTFQFDRIPEIDYLEANWMENELRHAQSAPEINKSGQ
uniref:Sugar transporter SWEET1 n=1 Tax=Panagrellus redivivus TaxID=6233 RepID=A0A7E4V2F6_PANRE